MSKSRRLEGNPREKGRPPKVSDGACVKTYYELEVIPGLAEFSQAELRELGQSKITVLSSAREDRVRFQYSDNPGHLLRLRRAVAVSRVEHWDISRPKALLGHQNFRALVSLIGNALALHPAGSFKTFHISAAGSGSSVFARIKAEIEACTGLQPTDEVGELLLAVRRPQRFTNDARHVDVGWEVAVRLSPRPLSARRWRVCDLPGALNGTVASTMMALTHPASQDRVVNLACGSGTLLIERLALGSVHGAVGCDISARALACTSQNVIASGNADKVTLLRCDAGRNPLPDEWATMVCADLPFGMLVGSHERNQVLYRRLVTEAGRLIGKGGRLVVITHEVRLFEHIVRTQAEHWETNRVIPIKLPANTRAGYIYPRIYLLHRRE